MTADEYRRKFRVLDQMLSMHSDLRDRYRRLAIGQTLLIMVCSIAGVSLALAAGSTTVTILGVSAAGTTWIAVLGAVTFFLTIVELVVEWRRQAWSHEDAAKRLAALKSKFRRAEVLSGSVKSVGVDLVEEYDATMAAIVEIPDKDFVPLKARHRRKVELSRLIDRYPGAPRLYLSWRVRVNGVRGEAGENSGPLEPEPPGAEAPSDTASEPQASIGHEEGESNDPGSR